MSEQTFYDHWEVKETFPQTLINLESELSKMVIHNVIKKGLALK